MMKVKNNYKNIALILIACLIGYLFAQNYWPKKIIERRVASYNTDRFFDFLKEINYINKELKKVVVAKDDFVDTGSINIEAYKNQIESFRQITELIESKEFVNSWEVVDVLDNVLNQANYILKKEKISQADITKLCGIIKYQEDIVKIMNDNLDKYAEKHDMVITYIGNLYADVIEEWAILNRRVNDDPGYYSISYVKEEEEREFKAIDISKEKIIKLIEDVLLKLEKDAYTLNGESQSDNYEAIYYFEGKKNNCTVKVDKGMPLQIRFNFENSASVFSKKKSEKEIIDMGNEFISNFNISPSEIETDINKDRKGNIFYVEFSVAKRIGEVIDETKSVKFRIDDLGNIIGAEVISMNSLQDNNMDKPKISQEEAINALREEYRSNIRKIQLFKRKTGFDYEISVQFMEQEIIILVDGDNGIIK